MQIGLAVRKITTELSALIALNQNVILILAYPRQNAKKLIFANLVVALEILESAVQILLKQTAMDYGLNKPLAIFKNAKEVVVF